jgi:stearoyl-CoA desaturase (delta-9 desaturase)
MRLALAICGSAAAQGMAIRWCATHRRHHQVSDRDGDPHSPHLHGGSLLERLRGMYHAHVGWCFDADQPDLARSIADLRGDPALLLIDQLYFFWIALGLLIPAVALGWWFHSWSGFLSGLIWGGVARIGLMQHVTWSINSVCHVWGDRPFRTADYSTNNFPIAILSLGEGWHNNHHAFPTSARHGLRWWQFDATYVVIMAMKRLGLAWDVNVPGPAALDAKLVSARQAQQASEDNS